MSPTLWQRLDGLAGVLAPAAVAVGLALIGVAHTGIPGLAGIAPVLPIAAVFFWSTYRPRLFPAPVAFAVGLLVDLLGGTPLGVYALVLLVVRLVVLSQRRYFLGKPFLFVWSGFALVAAGTGLLAWALMCINAGQAVLTAPALFQFLLAVAVYPFMTRLFLWVDGGLMQGS
ncbi:MAG: rod shape-determining protein MreD [Proteobacteria bacterium]|nr:rod shape-determining protein MreD [Pseudomonadota bacterium]